MWLRHKQGVLGRSLSISMPGTGLEEPVRHLGFGAESQGLASCATVPPSRRVPSLGQAALLAETTPNRKEKTK